jgi:hypothetical protein
VSSVAAGSSCRRTPACCRRSGCWPRPSRSTGRTATSCAGRALRRRGARHRVGAARAEAPPSSTNRASRWRPSAAAPTCATGARRSSSRSRRTRPTGQGRGLVDALVHAFHAAHRERYGYDQPEAAVELVTLRVRLEGPAPGRPAPRTARRVAASRTRRSPPVTSSSTAAVRAASSTARRSVPEPRCGARGGRRPRRHLLGRSLAARRGGRARAAGPRGGRPVSDSRGRSDHPRGGPQRAGRDRGGSRRGAAPHRVLAQHQGTSRLFHRGVRRPGADGGAGRAHPGPPRLDARLGPRRARGLRRARPAATRCWSPTPTRAAPTCRTGRWSRRSTTATAGCSGTRRTAPTTPTSAAPRRDRCPRRHRDLRRGPPDPAGEAARGGGRAARPRRAAARQHPDPRRTARRPAGAGRREPLDGARLRELAATSGPSSSPRDRPRRSTTPSGRSAPRSADFPDGTYRFEDVLDDDGTGVGPIPIRATLTIAATSSSATSPTAPTRCPAA